MKNLSLIIFVLIFCQIKASSQPCLPEGITFETQSQIDSFQINNPGCTEIEGDVRISGDSITNLNGLSVLTSIGGYLRIVGNDTLTNLTGLDNLTTIGRDLRIQGNPALTSLTGLDNLTSIGWNLKIYSNAALTSLTGLDNVTSIGFNLDIYSNDALTSLTGLDNLTTIGRDLLISYNGSLSTCEAQWLCEYLSNPSGSVNIYNNATGCNNPPEIANLCGITLPCLPYGNYYFFSQADIDNFQSNYPGCFHLEGGVIISGDSITTLNRLNVVTSIGGNLNIHYNETLTILTGLDNVTSIGGDLSIHDNDALTSLTGLDNVTFLGGSLEIGFMYAGGNPVLTTLSGLEGLTSIGGYLDINKNRALTSLTGLDNVTSIGGPLWIYFNSVLTSLTGLENVTSIGRHLEIWNNEALTSLKGLANVTSIPGDLLIGGNYALTSCEIQSVCDYLASPNGNFSIHNNAPGCNTQQEVEDACDTLSVENLTIDHGCLIYPNPVKERLTISSKNGLRIDEIAIYNQIGQKVLHHKPVAQSLDVSMLRPGMFVLEAVCGNKRMRGKFVK